MDLALENKILKEEIAQLKYQLEQLYKLLSGSKSERYKPTVTDPNQLSLFDLGEDEQSGTEDQLQTITYTKKKAAKNHVGRNDIPEHFPVEEIIIEPEQDTTDMIKVGEEVTEHVEYTPPVLKKIRTIRPKYAPKDKEGSFVIADIPLRALPKCMAGESLIIWLIIRKFVEHMPFYRQRQAIKRDFDWDIPSSTINDWFISVCSLLEPLYNRTKDKVLQSGYVQVDESPIKVQDNNKKGSTHQGYQWVYHSPEDKLLFFDYRKGRGKHGPKEILEHYVGLLQSDGYGVYDKIGQKHDIDLGACLVHVRRPYHDALSSDKVRAEYALGIFSQIYAIEATFKTLSPNQRKEERLTKILPLIKGLKAWVDKECVVVLPKSPIGKAMTYTQNQWNKVMTLFQDGRYELDNNLIENKIRPLALGRKNYLFAGSHVAAQRIAMMYTFFGSCAANDVNPSEWLTFVLDNIAHAKINDLDRFLPCNFKVT